MGRPARRNGFTLTEALIALTAALAVLGAGIDALMHFQQRLIIQRERVSQFQDLRLGLQVLEDELRMAGTGSPAGVPPFIKTAPDEVQFQANLSGLTTRLTVSATAGQTDVSVDSGVGWTKGKRIVLCAAAQCIESKLAKDGRVQGLSLSDPLSIPLPAGTVVYVSNQVRYYLRDNDRGQTVLMRMVDGGANALVEPIGSFRLRFLDRNGTPTADARLVKRVRIEAATRQDQWTIVREVAILGQRGME